jgi:AcrR family transcriptional regulator
MPTAARMKKAVVRRDKTEWLDTALEVIAREGGAKLRIDTLVKEMGVTKGSFYWHFENRDDFVMALLEHWHRASTLNVPQALQGLKGSASERLRMLITLVVEQELTRYDLAIRSWAIQEPNIRPLVRRTDVFRLNFVRDLFREMGFDATDADMRARMLVTYMALDGAVFDKQSKKKRVDYVQRIHAMVVRKN